MMKLVSIIISLCLLAVRQVSGGHTEAERVAEYHKRNYTWPLTNEFIPNTKGWRDLMQHRLRQISEIEDSSDRFEGFAQTLSAAVLQPNFTEHGFGLVRAPEDLMVALREGVRKGVEEGPAEEKYINAISGDRPWFIHRPGSFLLSLFFCKGETWRRLNTANNI